MSRCSFPPWKRPARRVVPCAVHGPLILLFLILTIRPEPADAGVVTPHLISYQGRVVTSAGMPLSSGDISVRVYDDGGVLCYDSGTDFTGVIAGGMFNVLLGSVTPLNLDNTRLYYLEVDVNGQEVVGDAAAGRQAFYPGGGSHERPDLESRITLLENAIFYECPPGMYDLNGDRRDSCEFAPDSLAIYVDAVAGSDVAGCGLGPEEIGQVPCRTISYGIQRAYNSGRRRVLVADGFYEESVTLRDGISLLGGHHPRTWERHLASTATMLKGSTPAGHRISVAGAHIGLPTVVQGLVILGESNPEVGGNTYAVWLKDAAGVELLDNAIIAGSGGPGSAGAEGSDGQNGMAGQAGLEPLDTGMTDCTQTRAGGAGGAHACGGQDLSGGSGGDAVCQPSAAGPGSARPGHWGHGAGGGFGGAGGVDGSHASNPPCAVFGFTSGEEGGAGVGGMNGTAGAGGADGTAIAFHWFGEPGQPGGAGTHGSGGGGGGASGGAENLGAGICKDKLGATGGGGGAGGCGASGGGGGGAGGGSFAVFVVDGLAPTVTGNRIHLGVGGPGGDGGPGGSGGLGGLGAPGGTPTQSVPVGAGGRGGGGGIGGMGGGGGGGMGGPAVGIYTKNVTGLPGYEPLNVFSGGFGGRGGVGGCSLGNAGGNGSPGFRTPTRDD